MVRVARLLAAVPVLWLFIIAEANCHTAQKGEDTPVKPMVNVIAPDTFFSGAGRVAGAERSHGLSVEDRMDILELTSRFEWCFDARRLDALSGLLTEDVIVDHVFGYAKGKADALKLLEEKVPFKGVRHEATNATLFINDKGQPSVLSFLTVVQVVADRPGDIVPRVIDHALVTDTAEKGSDGLWRISKRTFEQMARASDRDPDPESRARFEQTAKERNKE